MKLTESAEFVHLHSPFVAMAFVKAFPMMAQLGVESSGRLRRHVENNLLRPGLGATSVKGGVTSFRQAGSITFTDRQIKYGAAESVLDWEISFIDERTFSLSLSSGSGFVTGECFRMAFSPEECPISVFGKWVHDKPFPPQSPSSLFEIPDVIVDFELPLRLSFPDCGSLSVSSQTPGVTARQTVSVDPTRCGLNLGCHNTGDHVLRKAHHDGTTFLSFHSSQNVKVVELEFSVNPELIPVLSGVDISEPKWNGLRRCWQNNFTLNPETLSMGDNPSLHGIAHLAIHFKSDVSVFTPPLLDDLTVHDILGRQLRITFRDCVGDTGEINDRYASLSVKKSTGNYGFFDGNTSNLIALYNYTAVTGDWSILTENIDNIRKAGRFLMAMDRDGDGILELPFDGNAFRSDRECRNWWDNFPFGHKDAFANLLAYRALGCLRDLLDRLNDPPDVRDIDLLRSRFADHFHRVFYNPRTGVYAGWVSADGRLHDYYFTFVSAMAINQGLVGPELSREVLQRLLQKLREQGYGDWKWGIPGPLESVSESDGHIWGPMQRWGSYENGGLCGQAAYHFIQALYRAGLRAEADEILFSMLDTFENEATHSGLFPGYMKSVDWRTKEGRPSGYNYLADNYYFLLAAITGHFEIPMPALPQLIRP